VKKRKKTYNNNLHNRLYPIADDSNLEKDEWKKYTSNESTVEPLRDDNGRYHYVNMMIEERKRQRVLESSYPDNDSNSYYEDDESTMRAIMNGNGDRGGY
jgi:hypothetical protein